MFQNNVVALIQKEDDPSVLGYLVSMAEVDPPVLLASDLLSRDESVRFGTIMWLSKYDYCRDTVQALMASCLIDSSLLIRKTAASLLLRCSLTPQAYQAVVRAVTF